MTPTTISSFMPSVSTLKPARSPGDGGGVVSATRLTVDGSRSCLIFGDDDDEEALGEGMVGDCDGAELELSQRFNFLAGGWVSLSIGVLTVVAGGERCEVDLELFGMWMPSNDSETDFRLVL